jgi:hypothetical protein
MQFIRLSLVLVLLWIPGLAQADLLSWLNPPPDKPFDHTPAPPPPDYALESNWAALPWRADAGDGVPPDSGFTNNQSSAPIDVLYLHPTTAVFGGNGWMGSTEDWITRFVTDSGTLPQQVTAFNNTARIFAPRFRQMRMASFGKGTDADRQAAIEMGSSDVERAFQYYLDHWNDGRGFIIASFSQGAMFTEKLLAKRAAQPGFRQKLVAAYLLGMRLSPDAFGDVLPLCNSALQTGCFISWNSIANDGKAGRYGTGDAIACVNPLSWKADTETVAAEANLGSLPMIGLMGIKPLVPGQVGARCDEQGVLWVDRPRAEGFTAQVSSSGSFHPYEYNLFYANIRLNAAQRAQRFLTLSRHGP